VPGFSAMPPTTPTERPDVAIEPVDPVDHTPPKYLGGIAGGLWSYISKQLAGDLRPGSSRPPPAGTPPIPGTEGGATSPVDPNRPPVSPLPPIGTIDNVNGKSAVRIEDVPGAIGSLSPTTPCIPPTPCVPQDYKTAVKWYRLAAEQGYADAQVNLGVMYTLGQGVRRNYKTAVKWYRLAAKQGHAGAQNNLGLLYTIGQGVPQDYKAAVKWFRLAAKQGFSLAQNNLGLLYVKGQGVVQDYVYAHMWWNIAASSGNKSAGTNRDKVAGKMTPSQLETAQKLARECVRKKYKGC
jgi:hypothetical protein